MKCNYFNQSLCRLFYGALFGLFAVSIQAQQSYTFITCGASGSVGPTQTQATAAYSLTNLNNLVVINPQGIQNWTVPVTGGYRIEAYGAQGGGTLGGLGAKMSGDFTLTAGTVLKILVGQRGPSFSSDRNISGGGGTYVVSGNNTILVIAGGGGASRGSYTIANGTVSANGNDGQVSTNTTEGVGGTNGAGGGGASCRGGGGAGWSSAGSPGGCSSPSGLGGLSFSNGGTGGGTSNGSEGGFGGGGSSDGTNNSWTYAGGGGGYSGGGGASTGDMTPRGGGGGSFNAGINQVNASGNNAGDGKVIITELCSIALTSSGSNSLAPSICSGTSLTLTTDAVSNYVWSTGNTSSNFIVVAPSTTTVYSVSGTSTANCTAMKSITVIVSSAAPVLTITPSATLSCPGKSVTLSASGAVTYTWSNNVSNNVPVSPAVTTTYTVTGANGCGTASANITISVAPLPVIIAASQTTVCAGKPVTLNAISTATDYAWSTNPSVNVTSISINPLVTTMYSVAVSDGTCSGSGSVNIIADPLPTISVTSSGTMICAGTSVTLTATGGNNYTWTPGNGNGSQFVITPTVPTLVTATGDNSFNCTAFVQVPLVVMPSPSVQASANTLLVCTGAPATLNISGNAVSYTWVNGPQSPPYVVNPVANTVYTLIGYGMSGCAAEHTVEISVFGPSLTVSGGTAVCAGNSVSLTASQADIYLWNNGSGFQTLVDAPATSTVYAVTVTTSSSNVTCQETKSISVTVNSNPTVGIAATRTMICKNETAVLTASGASTYSWSTGPASPSISVTSSLSTLLVLTARGFDNNGCSATAQRTIRIDPCNGIGERTFTSALSVFPNPNQGSFSIVCESAEIVITDQLGREVRRYIKSGPDEVVHAELQSGIYFVQALSSGITLTRKIVVQ